MKVNDFYKNIYSTSSIKALESKFNYLSYDKKIDINEFLTVRIILSLLIFIVSIYYFNSVYFLNIFVLMSKLKKEQENLKVMQYSFLRY